MLLRLFQLFWNKQHGVPNVLKRTFLQTHCFFHCKHIVARVRSPRPNLSRCRAYVWFRAPVRPLRKGCAPRAKLQLPLETTDTPPSTLTHWGDFLLVCNTPCEELVLFFLFVVRMQCTVTWQRLFGLAAHLSATPLRKHQQDDAFDSSSRPALKNIAMG